MATYTPVITFDFNGTNGTDIETLHTRLDPFPTNQTGYYSVISNACKLEFTTSSDAFGLADITGTYTDDQYMEGTLGSLSAGSGPTSWLGGMLQCQGTRANPPTATSNYRLRISQDTDEGALTTKIQKMSALVVTDLASTTSVTWANGNKFRFEVLDGVLSVYRDTGSGFGSAILTYDDSGSQLTGGKPGFIIRRSDIYTLDDVAFGDVTAGGGGSSIAAISHYYRMMSNA